MTPNERARRIAGASACFLACASAVAHPPASVCPARTGAPVSRIDLFDGDPADQALLAPDDDRAGQNTYSVKNVYDAGRTLTIRCHHGATSEDVRLVKPVALCTFNGDEKRPALTCK
jgi:hypothetical protein